MRVWGALFVSCLLAACGPKAPNTPSAQNAAESVPTTKTPEIGAADTGRRLVARGTEPFWAAEVEGTSLTLTRPDYPPMTTVVNEDHGALDWLIFKGDGLTLSVHDMHPCSDGMSDQAFRMAAELKVGAETLKGCASYEGGPESPKLPSTQPQR
jgi:uncharacterized membrane protein